MESLQWTQPAAPAFLPGSTLAGIRLEFRYDGLSRRLSKKTTLITNGIAGNGKALDALRAAYQVAAKGQPDGVFKPIVSIAGQMVQTTGCIVDGVAKFGNAWIP
jgi:hypothetical protein